MENKPKVYFVLGGLFFLKYYFFKGPGAGKGT
jgi:hypothetical protein